MVANSIGKHPLTTHSHAIAIHSTHAAINATINSAIQLHTYLKTKEFRNTT